MPHPAPDRPRRRTGTALATVVVALAAASPACSPGGAGPPVAVLGPPPPAAGSGLCDLADDPAAVADLHRWSAHAEDLAALLPPEVDVAAVLAALDPAAAATPPRVAALDLVWDAVDEHCRQDPRVERCRDLIVAALADPLGWAVRAGDPAEVEAAFALAGANWAELRDGAPVGTEAPLRAAFEAHLRFALGGATALAAVGWEPGRLDVLEPLEADLVALGAPAVAAPLAEAEAACGLG